ncbi:pyridoxine 5'-phosphate synthase [Jannaschia pohangensis]|uniref:Pyridoxine 5'-phosphate synthase n=1 Tax=Jannaschia pohangensis TaxID=390807 RepID=A0A1I3LHJ4_9RHOB|nr:pyridoxine 5'-phosphate synthase [Jannaschia pohangensis]SFI84177.1 pyridoxine 5'-phosphate synthase [Jannaschia pohangensis]
MDKLRLGVNIDHVATIRNARGGDNPDPVRAALMAEAAGADGITAHLREDRRHIRDADMEAIKAAISIPLNFEMAATEEMQRIALATRPHAVCLVPERREERTTEGGLEVAGDANHLKTYIAPLQDMGARISLFIASVPAQIEAAARVGADIIELHVGAYCDAVANDEMAIAADELVRITAAARQAADLGLEVHAGHGITYDSVAPIAAIPQIVELNIGHFLIGESVFRGMPEALGEMRRLMDLARESLT